MRDLSTRVWRRPGTAAIVFRSGNGGDPISFRGVLAGTCQSACAGGDGADRSTLRLWKLWYASARPLCRASPGGGKGFLPLAVRRERRDYRPQGNARSTVPVGSRVDGPGRGSTAGFRRFRVV